MGDLFALSTVSCSGHRHQRATGGLNQHLGELPQLYSVGHLRLSAGGATARRGAKDGQHGTFGWVLYALQRTRALELEGWMLGNGMESS